VIRLSVPFRQALSRLTLPVMLMLSLGIILFGRADQDLGYHMRAGLDDVLAPAYAALAGPVEALEHGTGAIGNLFNLAGQNAALRAENAKALEAQNDSLKSALDYVPSPTPEFFTAPVVADLGGVYARSVLVSTAPGNAVSPAQLVGAVAMDGRGIAGRVVEAGSHSARILLITDLNSRIPVGLGVHGAPALMTGTNGPDPQLLYWSPGQPPAEGDMVLSSSAGGAFPPGLPIGIVHYSVQNAPEVLPLADLDDLRLLRLFVYPTSQPELTPIVKTAKPAAKPHRHG
jgi:rod shape-determining protein MreC